MLITDSFVFLEIPASGGELIRPVLHDHLPVADYNPGKSATYDDLPPVWSDLPGFYVVRSPWSWYVSWVHRLTHAATVKGDTKPENMSPGKRAIWEDVFRFGEARFKEIVTRLCVGDFDHPLVPTMREEGIDFYSARVKQIVGDALERPDFAALKFEELPRELPRFLRTQGPATPELRKAIRRTPMELDAHLAPQLDYDEALAELVSEKTGWFCERFGYPGDPVTNRRETDAQRGRGSRAAAADPAAAPGAGKMLTEGGDPRTAFAEQARRHAPYLGVTTDEGSYLVATDDLRVGRSLFVKGGRPEFRILHRAVTALEELIGDDAVTDRQFVDVGANIGTETIPALLSHPFGSAVCCEPDQANHRLLRANLALNDLEQRVQPLGVAASNRNGQSKFVLNSFSGGNSWVAVDAEKIREHEAFYARLAAEDPGRELPELTIVEVELVTLNELVQSGVIDADRVGMLWIDAEGHEGHVLEGADALAGRGVPVVLEFSPAYLDSRGDRQKVHDVAEQCYTHFVDLRRKDPSGTNHRLRPVTELQELAGYLLDPSNAGNFTDLLLVRLDADQATAGAELPERIRRRRIKSSVADERQP